MKYEDLVQFDPVESIKVLTEANDLDQAKEDVRTFVISARIAEQLKDIIVPNLQFDQPKDNKGLLVVANYGTGKTHLMSVLSAVAEREDLLELLTSDVARKSCAAITGRFRVIRAEIGATQMSLRDIVCKELERGLETLGVAYKFPDAATVTNTKDSLRDMMGAFEEKHPDRGLLFVLDELLDYLRARKDAELIQDLAFLREVGEISRGTRLRFVAGIQEAIFDNPRFSGVADAVKRVKDRFEQVRISREDVAFVVQERLLRKTTEQRDQIRAHLSQFTMLYDGMAESLEEFVGLFPVHPAYLRTFERITAVEKREVLKTMSKEIARMLANEVPSDESGLVCYDTYRARLEDDPSNRQIESVREVLDKTAVLRTRVEKSLTTKSYIPTALRIIDALAIQRLTTDDINVPIGPTREELRDDLCLLPPNLPERDAFFLATTVDSIIAEIMKAISGQFISENTDNGQVYLDVRKDIDYDQKIEDRAAALDDYKLDEAYFKALEELLERRDAPYVSGYRIWEYELPWADRNVLRTGYLFMGAPNERSTAQPPRDFYIYFLQPYDPPPFKDAKEPDEVFFRLEKPDDQFTEALRRYAGATALATESTAAHRSVYEDKAKAALQLMVGWLRTNMRNSVTVTHAGDARPLGAWLGAGSGPRGSVKDQVDTIAATALAGHFSSRYPGYPKFPTSVPVGRDNVEETVRQALTQISSGRATALGTKILEALDLLDLQGNLGDQGEFAHSLLEAVQSARGQAVNRPELLVERDPKVWSWPPWHLEPCWLVVVAAALVQQGRMEIGVSGGQVDALGLDRLAKLNLQDLESFSHLAPPKELPVIQLREVVKLLGLPSGIIPDSGVSEEIVKQVLARTEDLLGRVVVIRGALADGMSLWGAAVIDATDERDRRLESLQKVLENVRARNSVGKMNKLDAGTDVITQAKTGLGELKWIEAATVARTYLADIVEYLREAVEVFGREHELSQEAIRLREEILSVFRSESAVPPAKVSEMKAVAEELRRRFADEASRAHARDRLDGPGDNRKREIVEGSVYRDLDTLASVSLLPDGAFGSLRDRLLSIGTCKMFDEVRLLESVVCPQCSYRPRTSSGPTAKATLDAIVGDVERLRDEWRRTLLDTLRTEEMAEQIPLLAEHERDLVQEFVSKEDFAGLVGEDLVRGLNRVFGRFEVRRVSPDEVWAALFPEQTATTPAELRERFGEFLSKLIGGTPDDKIRFLPAPSEEPE